jgi:hypothetical protein
MLSERSFAWIPSPPIRLLRSFARGGSEEHRSDRHDRRRQRRQQSQDIELVHSTRAPYGTSASSRLARAVASPVDADVACSTSRDVRSAQDAPAAAQGALWPGMGRGLAGRGLRKRAALPPPGRHLSPGAAVPPGRLSCTVVAYWACGRSCVRVRPRRKRRR